MKEKVEAIIDKIRPALQADGGNIELVDVIDGIVMVKLMGACAGCQGAQMTLKMVVEKALKEEIPEVIEVKAVQ